MKTIAGKNLPFRPPIVGTATAWLVLDRLSPPDYAWGVVGTLYALVWIAFLVSALHRETVDLFDKEKP